MCQCRCGFDKLPYMNGPPAHIARGPVRTEECEFHAGHILWMNLIGLKIIKAVEATGVLWRIWRWILVGNVSGQLKMMGVSQGIVDH